MTLGAYHPGLAHPKVPHAVNKQEKRRTTARFDREECLKSTKGAMTTRDRVGSLPDL